MIYLIHEWWRIHNDHFVKELRILHGRQEAETTSETVTCEEKIKRQDGLAGVQGPDQESMT